MKRHPFPTALWATTFVALLGAGAVAAEPEPSPEAKARFKAGLEALRANRNDDAYRDFKEVYATTQKWTALGNLGIAADRLERDGEAIDARQAYLDRGGAQLGAKEARQVRRDLERLRAGIATVTLEASGQLSIIDTRVGGPNGSVVNRYGPFEGRAELRVRAGEHQFQLERAGAVSSPPVWSVILLAGDTATHSFAEEAEREIVADFESPRGGSEPALSVPEDDSGRSHTAAYVLWGSGAAVGALAGAFYLNARAIQGDADDVFDRRCASGLVDPSAGCVRSTAGDEKAAHWRTASLVTGAAAAGALIAGTVLYIVAPTSPETGARDEGGTEEARVRPWISPTGLGVSGTF